MPNVKVSFTHIAHVITLAHCETELKAVFGCMSSSIRTASLT